MDASARPHRRLIWKYTVVVVALVAARSCPSGSRSCISHTRTASAPSRGSSGTRRRLRRPRSRSRCRISCDSSRRSRSRPSRRAGRPRRAEPGLPPPPRTREAHQPAPVPRRDGTRARPRVTARDRPGQWDRPLAQPGIRRRAGGESVLRHGLLPARLAAAHVGGGRRAGRRRCGGCRDRPRVRPPGHRARADRDCGLRLRRRPPRRPDRPPGRNLVLRHTSFASLPQVRAALLEPKRGPDDASVTGQIRTARRC